MPKIIGNLAFGKIVASLRKDHHWTQRELSTESAISYETVVNIEVGRVAKLDSDILNSLAKAFRLTSREKKEFFMAAVQLSTRLGNLSDDLVAESTRILNCTLDMLQNIRLPAFVFDNYMDLVAINPNIHKFLEIPEEAIQKAPYKWCGFNVMRVVFDPESGYQELVGREVWKDVAISNIRFFRVVTLRAREDSHRFDKVLKELMDFREFKRYWSQILHDWELEDHYMDTEWFSYHHRTYGTIKYFYLPTTIITPLGELHMVVYAPSDSHTVHVFEGIATELDRMRANGAEIPLVRTLSSWPVKSDPLLPIKQD